ncbi:hypothetical protein ACIBQX_13090 [Nonomuraea sp. NPDC049714]|uniref:hypothetical protein n=1 Tax=Nonomuraea sp. NPDC049714 TaxID=3364357 RepID=UPI00379EF2FB
MDVLRRALGVASLAYGLIFSLAALLHAGFAFGPVAEPVIVPAVIVETICAVATLAGGYGALAGRARAWDGLIYAHAVALAGVLLGILALALGGGEATVLNTWYHRSMATLLALGLGGAFYVSRVRR